MRYKLLGRSGLRVSELCLGAMMFGVNPATGVGADDQESRAMFDLFADAGGTFIDTASTYSGGRSEELLGDFLAKDRDQFVVSTKYTNSHDGGISRSGNSRRNMIRSLETSLRRLRTDRIDVFWLHNWDSTTPVDELLRAFDDIAASGKALYFGLSNTPAWEISRANTMADLLGKSPAIAIQLEYSLLERSGENDLLPMAKALDLGVTAWSPLKKGFLARRPDGAGLQPRRATRPLNEDEHKVVGAVADIADQLGATPAQVALAAIRQNRRFGQIIPVLGASRLDQLRDNLGCLNLTLDDFQCARLDALTAPVLNMPHSLLRSEFGERLFTGGQAGVLDNHRA